MNNVRNLNSILLFIWLCFAQVSWASGSRVGNGSDGNSGGKSHSTKIEISNDIVLESAAPFATKKKFSEGVRLEGPIHVKMKKTIVGVQPVADYQTIDILRLSTEFPELINKSQLEVSKQLTNSVWTQLAVKNACAIVKKRATKNKEIHIVMWGTSDGFVISNDNTALASEAVQRIIESANIETRGCTWK